MEERINPRVVDEGDGCFTLVADSPEEAARLRVILGPTSCGLGITSEEQLVVEEVADTEETDVAGLCCVLEPGVPWDQSLCRDLTGLDEAAIELIREAIRFADAGG